jgi:hypothetical protein
MRNYNLYFWKGVAIVGYFLYRGSWRGERGHPGVSYGFSQDCCAVREAGKIENLL